MDYEQAIQEQSYLYSRPVAPNADGYISDPSECMVYAYKRAPWGGVETMATMRGIDEAKALLEKYGKRGTMQGPRR